MQEVSVSERGPWTPETVVSLFPFPDPSRDDPIRRQIEWVDDAMRAALDAGHFEAARSLAALQERLLDALMR